MQLQPIPSKLVGIWELTSVNHYQPDGSQEHVKSTGVVLTFNADSTYVAQYDIGPSRHDGHFRILSTDQLEITVERDSVNKPLPVYIRTFRIADDTLILSDNISPNTATPVKSEQTYYRQKS